jgi:L-threonylcarbamoyladenylate synthase
MQFYISDPDIETIKTAAEIIKKGGVVIFPTETVYGIGADVFNTKAIKKIFKIKGRSFSNPLSVHLSNKKDIQEIAVNLSDIAYMIIEKFLPGPLTIVLEKNKNIPDEVTAGKKTVGIRIPDHPVALRFIEESQTFIAAPSANFSGEKSPKNISEIPEKILSSVDFILDCGDTKIGVPSTVIDLTQNPPVILREGAIRKQEIQEVIRTLR